jgi:hypothetical protein
MRHFNLLLAAILCAAFFNSCQPPVNPFQEQEKIVRDQFGADACHIHPFLRIVNGDTLNVVNVQLVNVRGAFSQLEEWRINVAVALAFYQNTDKSLLEEYDGISGVITKTEETEEGIEAKSKEYALTVEEFAVIDSVQNFLKGILDERTTSGDFKSTRKWFDTLITDSVLVVLDTAIDIAHQLGGTLHDRLLIGYRYVTLEGFAGEYVETEIAEEVERGWIVHKFILDPKTGKIVGFKFWVNG